MPKGNQHSTFSFIIVRHRGTRFFFDPESGRATHEILESGLSLGSSIELARDGVSLARAAKRMVDPKTSFSAFQGAGPLLKQERSFRRPSELGQVYASSIKASSRGLLISDRIKITLPPEAGPRHRWTPRRWFKGATSETLDAAWEAYQETQMWNLADRLVPNLVRFHQLHSKKPWRDVRKLLKRYEQPKKAKPRER